MRVVHIVHGKVNPAGPNGISRVVYHLNKNEKAQGVQSEIWAVTDDCVAPYTFTRDAHVQVECFPRVKSPFGHHPIIARLKDEASQIDLVHFHMVWFLDKNFIANALRKVCLKYVVTTHGTYSKPHALTGKRRIAKPIELNFLKKANAVHAITYEEADALATYGYPGPVFVEPNGIAVEEIPGQRNADLFGDSEETNLIWVGVKRPDKNLSSLVHALRKLAPQTLKHIHLHLFGPDHRGHEDDLSRLIRQLELNGHISLHGAVYESEKYDVIESADIFVLPSENEVFALAMLDAMACAKPCLVSNGCGYGPFADHDFCIEFSPNPQSIANAIEQMIARKPDWSSMGHRAQVLIAEKLNWPAISADMTRWYQRVIDH